MLPLTRVDVQIQTWAEEGNNIDLLNSLQGYRAEVDAKHPDMYKQQPEFVPEIYLANAYRHYCLFVDAGGSADDWTPTPNYVLQDRGAGIHQGAQMLRLNITGYTRRKQRV